MPDISLSKRYRTSGGDLDRITFRDPNFTDYMELGEPIAQGWMEGGVLVQNVNFDAVRAYAEKLVQAPWDAVLLGQLAITDAKKIRDMVVGFFIEPAAAQPSGQTTSSSNADGQQSTSSG